MPCLPVLLNVAVKLLQSVSVRLFSCSWLMVCVWLHAVLKLLVMDSATVADAEEVWPMVSTAVLFGGGREGGGGVLVHHA